MKGYILAVNDGIGSSAGLFKDGKAVICVEEERFNRKKNWLGFPELAIERVLATEGVDKNDIDYIVITNERVIRGSKDDFYDYYDQNFEQAWDKLTSGGKRVKEKVKGQIKESFIYSLYNSAKKSDSTEDISVNRLQDMGFSGDKIIRRNHHKCHGGAAYYGLAQNLDDKYLVMTLDGGGDEATDSVSVGFNGDLEIKSSTKAFSIGNMYSCITYLLGFKAHEHEYKLMGLAPYVNPDYAEKYCEYFRKFLDLKNDDTEFFNPIELNHETFFNFFMNDLRKDRFDNIAAGLQKFTEEICLRWIKGNIKKHGINKLLLSGGVFMNVKLNKLISQLPEVEFVNVFPSCGDETNIFGAAYMVHNEFYKKEVGLLSNFTLGTKAHHDLSEAIKKYDGQINVEVSGSINEKVAELLADNNIIARCSGNMEFGARALGNRSIMANPSRLQNITKINHAVKKRDFWMPFAPAILIDEAEAYVEIPDSIKSHGSPYMMFAVDTLENEEKRQEIVCGIHQNDFTARIEGVNQELYPDFYEIISEFKKRTGTPCVLNTSFNLHGFPIVENSDQAIYVLLNSKIDYLIIENHIISRS